IEAVIAPECAGQSEVVAFAAAADASAQQGSTVRAGLGAAMAFPAAPLAPFGDDVDDAGQRVRAEKGALRPAQHLDPVNFVNDEPAEIEFARGRLACLDSVDQHH